MGVVKSVQLVVNDWVVSKLLKGDINLSVTMTFLSVVLAIGKF